MTGAPAIVAAIEPRFQLEAKVNITSPQALPWPAEAPAGRLLIEELSKWKSYELAWMDPHPQPLGLGSSSAQFLFAAALLAHIERQNLTAEDLVRNYWKYTQAPVGQRPSGLDLLSQYLGGVHHLSATEAQVRADRLPTWDHKHATFILAFSGKKEKTHLHLERLHQAGFPDGYGSLLDGLNVQVDLARDAWLKNDGERLGAALSAFQSALEEAKVSPPAFSAFVKKLANIDGVLGCKGSGAQGGDCVLLLIDIGQVANVTAELDSLGVTSLLPCWAAQGLTKT